MEGIATDAHHADLGSGLVLVWGFGVLGEVYNRAYFKDHGT